MDILKDTVETVVEASFLCSVCDREAGRIRLCGSPSSAQIRRESFTSAFTAVVPPEYFEAIRSAIAHRDLRALYSTDLEYVPFFCPQCNAVYCGDHWEKWDVWDDEDPSWHDSIRGKCPKGHERKLED